ncbi:DUF2177 family protein [Legionella geestiana]|uniref:DUF2177 family protein n=1 Tax=Legionella geestiana TaxID=45065 RepID=UPI001092F688|nr:DUF2177 family protein [Legionella geestiana]QDQ40389.1 DUF2177 family protein [Legionella geestiana]
MTGISVKAFFIAFTVFIVTDMIWLVWIAKNLYISHYRPWLRLSGDNLQPIWWAALFIYVLFALAMVFFILPLAGSSVLAAVGYGALLGAIVYGVYDFTCLAIFKDFPVGMAFFDWAWGTVLFAFASAVTWHFSYYA